VLSEVKGVYTPLGGGLYNILGDGIREIKVNDSIIKDPVKMCNKFNEFFVRIGSNLAKIFYL